MSNQTDVAASALDHATAASLYDALTGLQRAIVTAFMRGVVAQASIAAAESEEAAEAKK